LGQLLAERQPGVRVDVGEHGYPLDFEPYAIRHPPVDLPAPDGLPNASLQ